MHDFLRAGPRPSLPPNRLLREYLNNPTNHLPSDCHNELLNHCLNEFLMDFLNDLLNGYPSDCLNELSNVFLNAYLNEFLRRVPSALVNQLLSELLKELQGQSLYSPWNALESRFTDQSTTLRRCPQAGTHRCPDLILPLSA